MKSKLLLKLGIVLIVIAMGTLPASAQEGKQPAEAGKPQISVPVTSFNFGYVPQGAKISHVYWMYNTGGDTLRIADIKPG